MKFKNRYLFSNYKDILLNNQIIIFGGLGSLDSDQIKKLKVDLKQKGFSFKHIKNGIFLNQNINIKFKDLITGPIFIIYKKEINSEDNLNFLEKFEEYKIVLSCFFKGKFYNFQIFKKFKNIFAIKQLYSEILVNIDISLSFFLNNTIKQLSN